MNKSCIPALAAALLLAAVTPACAVVGSGHSATEERNVAGYHGIGLSAPADVEIVQGAAEGVTVTADDNVLPKLETIVENGILKIRMRDDESLTLHQKIAVVVRARSIDNIAISGSGDVTLGALATQALDAHVSGSGDITAAGRADTFNAHMAGSGDVKASHLQTENADVRIAGSSDVSLWVKKSLKVTVAGSGDVRYYGDPAVHPTVVGSGDIKRLGASPP